MGTTTEPVAPGRLLRGAGRHVAGRAGIVLLCSTAAAGAALATPAVLAGAVDAVLAADPAAGRWTALCAALVVAEVALDACAARVGGTGTARASAWLRRRAVRGVLRTAPHRAAAFPAGDLATRLTANAAEAGVAPVTAATALAALVPPVGGLAALFVIDPWAGLAFLAGVPLLLLLLRAFVRGAAASGSAYQRVQARIAGRLAEALGGARTIAAAHSGEREYRRVLAPLPELGAHGRANWRVYGRAAAGGSVLLPLLTTLVLAVGGLGLAAGRVGVGELLALARYATLAAGVGLVTGALNTLVRGRTAAARVAAVAALPGLAHGTRSLPPDGTGTLELRGVGVVHDGRTVLDGIDLTLPGGTTTAVVGASGAGKSLLAAVAGRLRDPDRGVVLLDGVPLTEIGRAELREAVSFAFERPALVGSTIADVIAPGPRRPDRAALTAAARAAGADRFATLLPQGYDTPTAEAPLSGGERQRLGLARAFAHGGRLMVLDDATSSLDTVTEREVDRALVADVAPGTRLIVAHRPSSAARADAVVWLEEGRVRGRGDHRRLWEDPDYRAVFAVPRDAGAHGRRDPGAVG
ncbi:ATP-binding cassette domain-containing protein [Streptomyces sp. NPDC060194]|uniref:ATP-binding cassette domain-containing protein n=1 Tax=Streptomyces sp. NPDC060194 TaxID=3347069 RepID=UPI00366952C1